MVVALFAGSFDPITNGHIEIIKSGLKIFDKIVIGVSYNINKKSFLPIEKRVELIKSATKNLSNVEVVAYEGLTSDYARKNNIKVLLRSIRNTIDFEYEQQIAQTNQSLWEEIETVYIFAKSQTAFISSSMVREVFLHKGDVSKFVPKEVFEYLKSLK